MQNVFAAYRDAVEGGKPQLLFWCKVDKIKDVKTYCDVDATKAAIEENYKEVLRRKHQYCKGKFSKEDTLCK